MRTVAHPLRWGILTVGPLHQLPWGEQAVRQFGFGRWYALTPLPGCGAGRCDTAEVVAEQIPEPR